VARSAGGRCGLKTVPGVRFELVERPGRDWRRATSVAARSKRLWVTVAFAGLDDPTVTNLPYDEDGHLVQQNGFGTIGGVRPPRTLQLVARLTF